MRAFAEKIPDFSGQNLANESVFLSNETTKKLDFGSRLGGHIWGAATDWDRCAVPSIEGKTRAEAVGLVLAEI